MINGNAMRSFLPSELLKAAGGLVLVIFLNLAMPDALAKGPGCSRPILVAASPMGPAMIIGVDGSVSGVARETLDLITKKTGCQFDYVVVPRVRAYVMLQRGEVDMLANAIRSPDRDEFAHFVQMGKVIPALVASTPLDPAVKSVEELIRSSHSIIRLRSDDLGAAYRELLTTPRMSGRVIDALAPENAVTMLLAGRGNGLLVIPSSIVDVWERLRPGQDPVVTDIAGMPGIPFGHYYSKTRMAPGDIAIVRKAIRAAVASGQTRKSITTRYPAWAAKFIITGIATPDE